MQRAARQIKDNPALAMLLDEYRDGKIAAWMRGTGQADRLQHQVQAVESLRKFIENRISEILKSE